MTFIFITYDGDKYSIKANCLSEAKERLFKKCDWLSNSLIRKVTLLAD